MRTNLRASSVMLMALAASPALAQEANDKDSSAEIVVTANRTESRLSKTPIAVSAITGEGLRDQGISNPTNLADAVPNLSIDRNNGLQITIRGISSTDNSEKGDPSASFLSDGVYIARAQAQEVSFYDLERVEVLRGPQGTLYGRNTTAGLINLISARPKEEFQASADIVYGNYNTIQTTGVLNVPVSDGFALRAAVNYDKRDSYLYQGTSVPSLDPGKENLSFRLGAKLDLSSRVHLYLKGDYSTIKGNWQTGSIISNFYQLPILAPAAGQRGVDPIYRAGRTAREYQTLGFNQSGRSSNDNNTWGIHGELEVDLSDNLTATYLGSYREFHRDEVWHWYTGAVYVPNVGVVAQIPFEATYGGDYRQQSHEIRFAYKTDRLSLQAGAYYFREKSEIAFLIFGSQNSQPGERGYVFGFPEDTLSKSLGFFGQMTFNVSDTFRLTAGIRQTKDDKSRVGATINHATINDPLDFTTATQPGTTNPRGVRDSLSNAAVSYSKITWRLGAELDLNPATLLYGTVSTGYKAGGFNDGCLAGQANCNSPIPAEALFYAPETLTAYELGLKTNLAGGKVRLSSALFHYDYTNIQLSQLSSICGGPCQSTSNAGKAKVDGVELEAQVRPSPRNQFDISVAYLNARYTDYPIAPGVNFAGEKLDRSPDWTVTAGYQYTLPIADGSLVFGARTRLSDSYHLISTAMRGFFRQPSFTKTDLTLTYNSPGDRFYIQGFAKNLENNITVGSVTLSVAFPNLTDGSLQFADPRTFGVRAGFKF